MKIIFKEERFTLNGKNYDDKYLSYYELPRLVRSDYINDGIAWGNKKIGGIRIFKKWLDIK